MSNYFDNLLLLALVLVLLGRIAVLCMTYVDAAHCYQPSSVVCRSVSLSQKWSPQKWLNRSRCRLDCGHGLGQGTTYWMTVLIPHGKGKFWGGRGVHCKV